MISALLALVILAVGLIAWHHIVYPALMLIAARWHPVKPAETPRLSVQVLIPAHNEAPTIAAKISNTLALDWPAADLRVLVISDGSSDGTAAIARGFDDPRVTVIEHTVNLGKAAVLNRHLPEVTADIVLLTDASAELPRSLLRQVMPWFADPRVGVVAPGYRLTVAAPLGEAGYWSVAARLKRGESALGSPIGCHGAAWLIRREAVTSLPDHAVNDDLLLPMQAVRAGWRGVYDPSVAAHETEPTGRAGGFRRRRRIAAGNAQQVWLLRDLLHPRRGGVALAFASGKALRVLQGPLVLLLMAALAGLWALGVGWAGLLLSLLISAGLVAAVAPSLCPPLATILDAYAAGTLGLVDYLHRGGRVRWHHRPGPADYMPWQVRCAKRVVDLVGATCALILTLPLWLPIACAIRLESRGPVLFRQTRVGRAHADRTELFTMLKFRSMRTDAEALSGPVWASKNDPRVTRVGRFLRRTRLDELPQLINVLRGEMSLVGPRPERPGFVGKLNRAIPFYAERTVGLAPGITGLAQIESGYDETLHDVRAKLLWDHVYALSLTRLGAWLRMDVAIAWRTVAVMVGKRGQ
ncbi:MAG: sugar transferase [Alphaproteobacteria bacterium]|nr:sugar transferase [Alphaproteobacteria bacterium]